MKSPAFPKILLAALLFLTASLAFAEGDTPQKVLKVFFLKASKPSGTSTQAPSFELRHFDLALPSDSEMDMAKKAIEDAGFKPEDLKLDEGLPLEMVILEVKKAYPDQPIGKKDLVNGIPVLKPTGEELDQWNTRLNTYKGLMAVLENFEVQFGIGGAPTLSQQLSLSYHTGDSFCLGLGYQFTPNFDTLVNFEWNDFVSANDARTGAFDLSELTGELLFKYRMTSTGVRPYLFAGPAFTESHYDGSFTFESFQGSVSYKGGAHFSMVGGAGFEVPFGRSHLFVQGEVVLDYLDSDTANFSQLDSTVTFIPIEIGLLFGK